VLRDVDARIERGVTAVLGPSGSGKSTLLRLLNRLADATSGTVRFDGEDVRALDVLALRRRAVLVPQLPAPLPGTVAYNVEYGPSLVGRTADVGRCLMLAGLSPEYADREADRLSVGEQQRLMLARALALEPEVLLLDEPTNSLDPAATRSVEAIIAQAAASGIKVVMATHDLGQARRLAGNVLFLVDGRLIEQAPAPDFFVTPASEKAAAFLRGDIVE
jgi:ABC-type phosphate transport system ATPase subunit